MPSALFQLAGKTALVTGGGSGLGRAICHGFSEAGARVAVADLSLHNASETVALIRHQGGEAFSELLDVTSNRLLKKSSAGQGPTLQSSQNVDPPGGVGAFACAFGRRHDFFSSLVRTKWNARLPKYSNAGVRLTYW